MFKGTFWCSIISFQFNFLSPLLGMLTLYAAELKSSLTGVFVKHWCPQRQLELYKWDKKLYLENYPSYFVRTCVFTKFRCDLDLRLFDPKMYRYLLLTIPHLCIKKYESCTLKTTQFIMSEPKCWQSSVVILTSDLLIPKWIGIFLLSSCIYVWKMKAVLW